VLCAKSGCTRKGLEAALKRLAKEKASSAH
jgi:hypothetical protein